MSKPKQKTVTPKLRFPEFRDAGPWEVKRLGDVFKFSSGNTPPKGNAKFWSGSLPWVSASSMYDTRIAQADHYISEEAINKGAAIAPEGAILLLVRGSMLFKRIPIGIATKRVSFNQDVKALIPLETDANILFFLHYLMALESFLLTKVLPTGIGAGKLETSDLQDLSVFAPPPSEQQKIADCLSSLDDLIRAEEAQLAALKDHKKGLMQQLFPAPGETTPRLRFPEFRDAGPWEVKRLGEIGPVSMCKRVMKAQTAPKGDVPFYKIGTFGNQADAYISRELYEELKSKYPFPKKGDILLSAAGTIGRTVVYDGKPAYFQDSNIVWIANDEKIAFNKFLGFVYKTVEWRTDDNTISRLYNENLRSIRVLLPSLKEQQKIASCLFSLDNLIRTRMARIEALKTHKRGLMQQLFPYLDGVRG